MQRLHSPLSEIKTGKEKQMHFVQAGKYSGREIRHLRMKVKMTQSDLASYLNVSPKTVESWESGSRQASGAVCRLLDLLRTSDSIPFCRPRHYLHGHSFTVPRVSSKAVWIDGKHGLSISIQDKGKKVQIPFPQELPDDKNLQIYHDLAGRLAVEEYLDKKEVQERLLEYVSKVRSASTEQIDRQDQD